VGKNQAETAYSLVRWMSCASRALVALEDSLQQRQKSEGDRTSQRGRIVGKEPAGSFHRPVHWMFCALLLLKYK
jgi:hypothetical protein